MNQWRRQVVRTGVDESSAKGASPLGGFGGMPPRKKILFVESLKRYFPHVQASFMQFLQGQISVAS
jgi:hypothetical protein